METPVKSVRPSAQPLAPTVIDADAVYVHIGYHKTGTTFLQQRVFPALGAQLDRVITPDCSYIAEDLSFDPRVFADELQAARLGAGAGRVVVSAETLSGRGDGNPMWDELEIAERLHQTFGHNGRIIAVTRNPADYIMSLYVFRVVTRGLERRSLDVYLRETFESSLRRKLDYHRLLSRYIELFGRDRVLVLVYEELRDDYEKFMRRLCGFMEAEIPLLDRNVVNAGCRNQSIVHIHRRLNSPLSMMLNHLRRKGRISKETYVRTAVAWYTFKRRCVRPVLSNLCRNAGQIEFPKDWELYMDSVFRQSNRRFQEIIQQDLGALGWPV